MIHKFLQYFLKNKIIEHDLTHEEQKSLITLDIKMPINVEKIKKKYKATNIFHIP